MNRLEDQRKIASRRLGPTGERVQNVHCKVESTDSYRNDSKIVEVCLGYRRYLFVIFFHCETLSYQNRAHRSLNPQTPPSDLDESSKVCSLMGPSYTVQLIIPGLPGVVTDAIPIPSVCLRVFLSISLILL